MGNLTMALVVFYFEIGVNNVVTFDGAVFKAVRSTMESVVIFVVAFVCLTCLAVWEGVTGLTPFWAGGTGSIRLSKELC